jgi:hypothetical protein
MVAASGTPKVLPMLRLIPLHTCQCKSTSAYGSSHHLKWCEVPKPLKRAQCYACSFDTREFYEIPHILLTQVLALQLRSSALAGQPLPPTAAELDYPSLMNLALLLLLLLRFLRYGCAPVRWQASHCRHQLLSWTTPASSTRRCQTPFGCWAGQMWSLNLVLGALCNKACKQQTPLLLVCRCILIATCFNPAARHYSGAGLG